MNLHHIVAFFSVDGEWGNWGAWGTCSVTCGGGQSARSRTCDNPRPQNGGLDCSGDQSEYGNCNTQNCPTAAPGSYVQVTINTVKKRGILLS